MIWLNTDPNNRKQWDSNQIIKGLKKLIPEIKYVKKIDEKIWISGEDACIYKGIPPFNHNLEYGEIFLSEIGISCPKFKEMKVKEMYVNGVHTEIHFWLEERGWYSKWYDAGTLFLFPYNIKGFGI